MLSTQRTQANKSLLVAACQEAGVARLYSEDMQDGADYDGVKVVNPFA